MAEPSPCPRCGQPPHIEDHHIGLQSGPYTVYCPRCYDGAPDAGPQQIGSGFDLAKAIEGWDNEVVWYEDSRD